jgi:DNA-directed RNA polymerase subunit beta'
VSVVLRCALPIPLVCTAFNADFEGDLLGVHLPLSAEAQAEARILMLSTNNILKPADGRPVTMPTQDMIIGHYFLTMQVDGALGEGRAFGSVAEALMAFDQKQLSVQAKIKLRLSDVTPPAGHTLAPNGTILLETTLGRALFNEALPADYPYCDYEVGKKQLGQIVNDLAERYPKVDVAYCLDALKDLGFHWATRSGVTVSIGDVSTPADKPEILSGYEDRAGKIDKQYERGLITEDERRQELIEIWTDATSRLGTAMEKNFSKTNPSGSTSTPSTRTCTLAPRASSRWASRACGSRSPPAA